MLVPVLLKTPKPKAEPKPPPAMVAHYAPPAICLPADSHQEAHDHEQHTTPAAPTNHGAHDGHHDHSQHIQQMASTNGMSGPLPTLLAILLHTGTMFVVMAVIAILVYERIGLSVLMKAWFNLDLLWAVALIGAGLVTLFV